MLRTLTLVALLLIVALPVTAGFKEGKAAYDRGDYKNALRELKPLAEKGHARAQYWTGYMYSEGHGVTKYYFEAVRWFRKSAVQGFADSQFSIGFMYETGRGVPRNYVLAYMWYNLAAVSEHDSAGEFRDALERKMTPAQIAQAQKMAAKWRPNKAGPTK